MSLTAQPPRVPIGTVNGQPVLISREWWVYLAQELFIRVGGTNGLDALEIERQIDALALLYDELAEQQEVLDLQVDGIDQMQETAPSTVVIPAPDVIEIAVLREQVAELTKAVEALQAGVQSWQSL